ncbi:ciliogenesis-associated TTC17-interacting protein [Haematobia irritans]|uniref:ciliogenesis-associated TTC17-interacting protein n=1 Tax=Haematobia irritans TaxID=7368 RepID=UPI003F50C2EB
MEPYRRNPSAVGNIENDSFEYQPCQNKLKLRPEDEISLDSIFSSLLEKIEPSDVQFRELTWDITAKDMVNEKQALLFEDRLYISQLRNNNCKLNEDVKIFMERELEEIGTFHFRVEESYDGYVVFGNSHVAKGKSKFPSGHTIKGKYDEKLQLICEKRTEYGYVDKARIERALNVRLMDDKLVAWRTTQINKDMQRFKAVINVKDRDDIFILDGGVLLFIRYLLVNNFRGDFNYFTMNLFGKILRCHLTILQERKQIKMFHRTFQNAIRVVNTQYFNNYPQEISETFYTANGKIILHYWHGFQYVLHETKGFAETKERIVPKLELMWRSQNELLNKYRLQKKLTYEHATDYFNDHPELSDFLMDFVLNVIKYKPQNVLEFTVNFFQKFRPLPKY